MKKVLLFLLFLLVLTPQSVFANGAGLPAFFKVNGQYAISNSLQVLGIPSSSFLIPQDLAPERYVVGEPITFDVDTNVLGGTIPSDILKNTKFKWDFGDGTTGVGLSNTHTYSRIGSYILVLKIEMYANDSQIPTQFIDSFLLYVVPTKDYQQLPELNLRINGQNIKGSLYGRVDADFSREITFDASSSKSPVGIIEYLWNFGDGQISNKPVVKHTYKNKDSAVIVLRVKDKNDFIFDAFVTLKDSTSPATKVVQTKSNSSKPVIFLVGVSVAFLILSTWTLILIKKSNKK